MKKITCRYGTDCWINLENIEGQKVLKLDFRIKNYKVCNNGWKEHSFPADIIVNDKLYLAEESLNRVVQVLDSFLEKGYLEDSQEQVTERGFSYLELKDLYGNVISIQNSSSAITDNIWFGCQTQNKAFILRNNEVSSYVFANYNPLISDRLHLNKTKVKSLKIALLKEWYKSMKKV